MNFYLCKLGFDYDVMCSFFNRFWNYAQLCICLSSSISFYSFWFVVSSSFVSFVFLIASQIWFVNNFEVIIVFWFFWLYNLLFFLCCVVIELVNGMSINSPNMKRTPPMCFLNIINVQQRMITYVLKSTYWVDSNPMML